MKIARICPISTSAIIVAVSAALFLNGCGNNGGSTSGSGGSPGPIKSSAEKNSFKEVTAHLDAGGNFYLYLSTEKWLDGLSTKIAGFRDTLATLPGMSTEQQAKVAQVVELITSLVKHSGVEEVSGFGMSSIAKEKDFYRTTSVLHHYPGNDSGYLWSLWGKKSHALDGLELLPENTTMAVFSDLDLQMLWNALEKESTDSGIPEVIQGLAQVPEAFSKATGMKLADVLDSLGGEYGFVLTLDDAHKVTLPVPGLSQQIPAPAAMLVLKVKDDMIFDALVEKLKGNEAVTNQDSAGVKMRTLPLALSASFVLRPTIARSGDYLFVASSDALIKSALAVQSGKKSGLKSTAEFKQLAQGLPEKGTAFSFISKKFGDAIMDIQTQAVGRGNPSQAAMQQKIMDLMGPTAVAYSVATHGDDGIVTVANGNQDASKAVLLVPVAVTAIAAGVALPALAQARTAAQGANMQQQSAPNRPVPVQRNGTRGAQPRPVNPTGP